MITEYIKVKCMSNYNNNNNNTILSHNDKINNNNNTTTTYMRDTHLWCLFLFLQFYPLNYYFLNLNIIHNKKIFFSFIILLILVTTILN